MAMKNFDLKARNHEIHETHEKRIEEIKSDQKALV
jgi:hypothetical protein